MRQDDDLSYFESSEFKEILSKYEASRENRSAIYMDADELTDVAEYYAMVCHDDEAAAEVIDLALQLHPDAVDPQIFRARKRMLDGDTETAQLICDAIDDQQHREVIFLRAELLIRQQRNDEAMRYLLDMADSVDEDLDYFYYDSAYIFIDYEDYSSAQELADVLEQMAPKWFKTWQVRADILLAQEDYEQAISYIERLLDIDPFYVEAWNWRCEAYCGLMQFEKAVESCDYALAVDPQDERALQLKAWVLMQQGNSDEAHELYQQLEVMNPAYELNYLYDSFCMYDKGEIHEALRLVEQAEELSGGMSTEQQAIMEHHAHILSELHDVEGSLQLLEQAEQQFGQSGDQTDYQFLKARVYAENNQPQQAVAVLTQCARQYPSDLPFIYYQGGQILFDTGYFQLAQDYFRLVLSTPFTAPVSMDTDADTSPDFVSEQQLHANTWTYLAACSYELQEYEASLDEMKKAVQLKATNLMELFGQILPVGTPLTDFLDYYYYHLYGTWPTDGSHTSDDTLPF